MEEEIQLMLSARFPLLWVVSPEEETAEETLCAAAQAKKAQIYFWDYARGWSDSSAAKGNPMQALERVIKAPPETAAIFVMKDIATLIAPFANGQIASNQLPIVREIKNLARDIARDALRARKLRRTLVILSDQLRLPVELREETTVVDFSLPSIEEISELVDRLVPAEKIRLVDDEREQLIKACQGLSRCRIARGKSEVFGPDCGCHESRNKFGHRGKTSDHRRDRHSRIYSCCCRLRNCRRFGEFKSLGEGS